MTRIDRRRTALIIRPAFAFGLGRGAEPSGRQVVSLSRRIRLRMLVVRWIGRAAAVWCIAAVAFGQPPPIADQVGEPLLPSGISELPVELNAELAYVFQDEDGTDALHFVGDFALTLGGGEGQELHSSEAVVWLTLRRHDGRPYHHLEMLLWRDAEIAEFGGTITTGPALFVSLSTFSEVTTQADYVALESSAHTQIYQEGNAIRKAVAEGGVRPSDEAVSLRVFDPSGLGAGKEGPAPRPVIHFQSSGDLTMGDLDGQQVMILTGGVYLSRGVPGGGEFLEIQADAAVVFFAPEGEVAEPKPAGAGLGAEAGAGPATPSDGAQPAGRDRRRGGPDRQLMSTGFGDVEVEAAYLEGDIRLSQGMNAIRASRLYYDFLRERALILDAVAHSMLVERNIPLYVRAAEIRQLSANEFTADDAVLTTSEFHTPHYHIGARRVELVNRTPPEPDGTPGRIRAGSFRIQHATLNFRGRPVAYWPHLRGDVDTSETAVKSARTGFSDDFGLEIETEWHLFNLLGLETPEGFDGTLSLDYFSERGPAIGIDADYERDRYFGEIKSYLLGDAGEDSLGRDREPVSPKDVRGRLLLRHRQYLEEDWQISLELSYISDESFLEEFFESEFDNDKEQETLVYLKKQRDNWAFTAHLQGRILDFTTQTERLPDFGFHVAGESLGDRGTWYSENRLGVVRYMVMDKTLLEWLRGGRALSSDSTGRADSRQEAGMPFDVGTWRLVPFAVARGTAWSDSPGEGGLARGFGTIGVRGSTYLTRVYPESKSSMFDIDGVRHIIKPDFVVWMSESNQDADDLFLFDETVEGIGSPDGAAVGLRQRWQTKRGADRTRRVVDVVTHDVEVGVFNDAGGEAVTNGFTSFSRPENSMARNYANSSFIWRVNDRTAVLSELNYDLNDSDVDILNVSVAVERTPRFNYLLGYRFIDESESNLLGFDMNYRLNEKHTLAVRELFDLERGRTLDFTVAFIRKFPRWFGALSFELDEAEDDFGVSVVIWPEGLPQAALGSRRFAGLTGTTRLKPD